MVLIRVALLVALAACNQSLFDNHGTTDAAGGGDDDTVVPATCPSPCAADLAADFNGTPGGANNQWRYLEDHRDHTWLAMTGAAVRTGADAGNKIAACTTDSAACRALPGALLISSAGATSAADPAVELTVPPEYLVQLSLRAVATGADQTIRLYRNSREDVLFTGTVGAGTTLEHAILLDVLPGDRYVLAVAPSTIGGDVAVQLFASTTAAVFPSSCQVALTFSAADGNTVANACGPPFTHGLYDGNMDTQPPLAAGPYAELGTAGDFTSDNYFKAGKTLDRTHDTTVQFWVKHRAIVDSYNAWLFSDIDLNNTGGLSIGILDVDPPRLDVETCATATASTNTYITTTTLYPDDHAWHFIRVVHTGGKVNVCLDGVKKADMDVPPGFLKSGFEPRLGADVVWSPQGAFFDGELDDVRVLTGALPCE